MYKVFLFFLLPFFSVFGQLCTGDPSPKSPCAGWEALSQLGSLMPERIWEQDFDIRIDRRAFKRAIHRWVTKAHKTKMVPSRYVLGSSQCYFVKSTMSGDNCRLIDLYQEFEWSPYWKYPPRSDDLRFMEKQIMQRDR